MKYFNNLDFKHKLIYIDNTLGYISFLALIFFIPLYCFLKLVDSYRRKNHV